MKLLPTTLGLITCCVLSGYAAEVTPQAGPTAEDAQGAPEKIWDLYSQAFEPTRNLRGPEASAQRAEALAQVMTNHQPMALIRLSPVQRPGRSKVVGVHGIRMAEGSASMAAPLVMVLRYTYELDPQFPQNRIIIPEVLAYARFDYIDTMPQGGREVLLRELKERFGVVARWEQRRNLIMTLKKPAVSLHKHTEGDSAAGFKSKNVTMGALARELSKLLGVDVTDRTQLAGGYDFTLDARPGATSDEKKDAILDQLGLQLAPAPDSQPIEFLVIEKL
jgi:uncharacterized protein (TIGR03435 family)